MSLTAPTARSDFADEFPMAEVIGTDLSPIQYANPNAYLRPRTNTPLRPQWVPPNCKFELEDASEDWTFPDNTFDYIHIRCMLGCIKDWAQVYRECMRCLKPGGWLEHTDMSVHVTSDDGSVPPDSAWTLWKDVFYEAGEKIGRTFKITEGDNYVRWMQEAGFSDVQTQNMKLPIGEWPADPRLKETGLFTRLGAEQGLEGFVLYICTEVLGWQYKEVQVLLARVRQALKDKSYHAYCPW